MSMRFPGWCGAVVFAIGALALGTSTVPLAFALAPGGDLSATAPGLHLPSWFFGAVWAVIHPCLGVASWLVWKRRGQAGAAEALALFGVAFLFFLAFLPITAAAHDQRVTAMMDLFGLVAAYAAAWVYWRVDATTLRWMLPLLVWMPVTALLKLATLDGQVA
jgi:tryptophan-rich sensory protein